MIPSKLDRINVLALPHPPSAAELDPPSNTGSNSPMHDPEKTGFAARLDYVTLLWRGGDRVKFFDLIDRLIGVKFGVNVLPPRKIGIVWHRSWTSPCGVLYSERDTLDGKIYCRMAVSGELCERTTSNQLRRFLGVCNRTLFGVTCSRIDIAVDDYSKELQYSDINQALVDGNYTGFRAGKVTINHGGEFQGFTVTMGSRDSEKFVRFYDKFSESHGRLDCYRWELEYKGDMAQAFFLLMLEFPEPDVYYQSYLADYAVSSVDFVDRNDKNIGRNMQLEWWETWLSRVQMYCFKVKICRAKTTISAKKNWVQRSVSKALLMLEIALGADRFDAFVYQIKQEAKARISTIDQSILDDYRINSERCVLAVL